MTNKANAARNEQLALCGDDQLTPQILHEIADASTRGRAVLLPTGAAYERPEHFAERALESVKNAGGTIETLSVVDRRTAMDEGVARQVAEASCIWIAGASALHVCSTLKGTPVLEAIRSALGSGALVIGSSGGATCLADPMVDARGGAFTLGLGLVHGLAIVTGAERQTPEYRKRSVEMAPADVLFVYLPLASALLHKGGQWSVEGDGVEASRAGAQLLVADLPALLPALAAAVSADN